METFKSFENAKNSASHYLSNQKGGSVIYIVVIVMLFISIASLPFISVDITFQSRGQIRPVEEVNKLTVNFPGRIEEVLIRENQEVKKGDVLLVLNTDQIQSRKSLAQLKLEQSNELLKDLKTALSCTSNCALMTSTIQVEKKEFDARIAGLIGKRDFLQKELTISTGLWKKGVVSESEKEKAAYQVRTIQSEILNAQNERKSSWENRIRKIELEQSELRSNVEELNEEKEKYEIIAPISGTIKNYIGIRAGNFLVPNQVIAEISPTGKQVVECYVLPKDIGYLEKGMAVRFQIDAFDYNQWGMAEGEVIEIFNDATVVNEQPVFRVQCALKTEQMQLTSGFVGELKKGMTLTGRFHVTERTLWQLLYDKVDDWLNPKNNI